MGIKQDVLGLGAMAVVGAVLLGVFGAILSGYVLSVLWGWFLVPMGMPPITLTQAIGISLIASFLTKRLDLSDDDKSSTGMVAEALTRAIVRPLLALGTGWIVTLFM